MVTPPSSLPCPSSSSAHHHQSFSTLSQIQPNNPPVRAPSAASHMSAASGRESKSGSHLSNGSVPGEGYSPPSDPSPGYVDPMSGHSQHTTQPYPGGPFGHSNPSTMLPQVTASPPPQAPPYIPPPQHAMAPDPIHSMAMNMMMNPPGPGGMMGPPGMPWQHGPGQWRPGPSNYPGQPPYPRPHMPNGHAPGIQRQLPPDPLEAYAPTRTSLPLTGMPNGMQVQTAAMLQQAILAANGSGRPLSAHGEGRERRRERERSHKDDERADGERESGRDEPEVITTIFVVGFPDDMGEREFQNIFTFSSGFEAATLKFPSSSVRREPAAALLAELSQIAANHTAAGEHGEMPPVGLEEALAASQMGGTANTSSSTTPSAAMSLTPSAPSGPTFGNPAALPQLPTRRQTIGFARFKTRAAAIAAKEHLQGRKIDSLIGATLKAEMAKKNLHTKRTTSGEELVGLLLRSGRLAGLMNAAGQQNLAASIGSGQGSLQGMMPLSAGPAPQPPSAREAWDSWPVQGGEREKAIEESRPMMPPNYPNPSFPYPTSYPPQQSTMATSAQSDASTSPPLSVKSPNGRPTDSKALLALAEEADEMEGWSVGGAVGMGMGLDGFHTHQRERERSSGSGTQPLAISNMQQGGINSYGRNDPVNYGISPPGGSDHMSDAGRSLGGAANPADQNPPINTLYVGNLPAISPPTHPPNFLEESLRALFSRCQGFKRMSFRQKINGPMCFVEYEDVPFASQAIKDLYGHNLGGLVKGGIRLSYSKNSLGQRGSSHPTGINSSILGGIAHTVALAGMSSPSTSHSVPGPGYGLQFQPGSGPNSQTAPISVRRSGDGMSLSPTAQPFNATLPTATSPRSRYFGSSPPNSSKDPQGGYNSYPPNSQPPSVVGPGPGGNGGQFSPVSSPIRTPASYSWVSSGGSSGYGFDPFAGHGMSLGGAASAWGQGGQGGNGGGNGSGGPQ